MLVRVDLNVPLREGEVAEDGRLRAVLPTLRYLREQGARVVLASHLGRPKGRRDPFLSLAPVARRLGELLGCEVRLAPDCVGPEVERMVERLAPGEVLLLENLRFHPEEERNDPAFAEALARLADAYVNDAFAACHRAHASVVGVPERVAERAAGFLLERELSYVERVLERPVRPLVAILGGAKVSDKLQLVGRLLEHADLLLIGGAMAFTFLRSQGVAVGRTRVEEELMEEAASALRRARQRGVRVYLPVDCVVAERPEPGQPAKAVPADAIPEGWMALDIGPATAALFGEVIAEARTILWNGPMGVFEVDEFAMGTVSVAAAVASAHALSVCGGGDTEAALRRAGQAERVSYISTGGGAFLELLARGSLPGVEALRR